MEEWKECSGRCCVTYNNSGLLEKKDFCWRKTTSLIFIFTALNYSFISKVAEYLPEDTLRTAADQAALQQPAPEFRGVGAASLFESSDLAAAGRVDGVAEAEVGEQHRRPPLIALQAAAEVLHLHD